MHVGKKQTGFTIVELLIVIVVIGILAAIVTVAFNGVRRSAQVSAVQADLRNAQTQLEELKIDSTGGTYPLNTNDVSFSDPVTTEFTSDGTSYCVTATIDGLDTSYYVDSTQKTIQEGACPGHTGGQVVANQPDDCPTGFIPVPGSATYGTTGGFCVMKYEAKNINFTAIPSSQAAERPWGSQWQTNAITLSTQSCSGCTLMSEAQRLTIAQNVMSVASNWSGGAVGSGFMYRGHTDNSPGQSIAATTDDGDGYFATGNVPPSDQRRTLTLTNGEVIWDFAGNLSEWTSGVAQGSTQPGPLGYAWRDWNSLTNAGTITPNLFPGFANPLASGWTATEGIGQINSSGTDTGVRGLHWGGSWSATTRGGIFALALNNSPDSGFSSIGFRVTR